MIGFTGNTSQFLQSLVEFFITRRGEIAQQTLKHLELTIISLALAATIGVLIGIWLTRNKNIANYVMGTVGVIQTIPSVALLGFLLPILGIGTTPAIVALFLYALLPIVRNTFIGIEEVNPSIKEAAKGMGMPQQDILMKVELPLAVPVIFAGIRTAAVTTVGVATLCALIASGGLGKFIFRGIALNNVIMILAGAIAAAGLALILDASLGVLQKNVRSLIKPILVGAGILIIVTLGLAIYPAFQTEFKAGFVSEFMERTDGYPGLSKHYNFRIDSVELDAGLMYDAVREKKVDVISGYSTDGRIKAFNLAVLEDDKKFFPPYYAAPLVRGDTLAKYPEIADALSLIAGKIDNETMAQLNYLVDEKKLPTKKVVKDFLTQLGIKNSVERSGSSDIKITSKSFTEQYILAEMMAVVIENYTNLDVELKTGVAGTKIAFEALNKGEVDLYPEYTGTGLLVILQADPQVTEPIIQDKDKVYEYVKEQTKQKYNLVWLEPFGFNNTYALMMRQEDTAKYQIKSISDLKEYLDNR